MRILFFRWLHGVFESNGHWADRMIAADEKLAASRPYPRRPA